MVGYALLGIFIGGSIDLAARDRTTASSAVRTVADSERPLKVERVHRTVYAIRRKRVMKSCAKSSSVQSEASSFRTPQQAMDEYQEMTAAV